MPRRCTRNWWRFPPQTREVQFDEKWAFVGKKAKPCAPEDPAAAQQGDNWDHVALDPEHRLVVSGVPGKRTAEKGEKLGPDCKQRTAGRSMNLITSDEYPAYKSALLDAYGTAVVPPRTGKPGRPKAPYQVAPPELQYATVHKPRAQGRVVKVDFRVICGTVVGGRAALAQALVSKAINTAFVERHKGTETVTATRVRGLRATASRRTGPCMRRSPPLPCTATTSAGRCAPSE